MDDIAREFIAETSENLDQADWDMVALENNPGDRELLARVFRTIHTIKGACGFLGYTELGSLTHNAETLLGMLRDGDISLSDDIVSAILDTLDNIRGFISDIDGDEIAQQFEIDRELVERLGRLAEQYGGAKARGGAGTAPAAANAAPVADDAETAAPDPAATAPRRRKHPAGDPDPAPEAPGEPPTTGADAGPAVAGGEQTGSADPDSRAGQDDQAGDDPTEEPPEPVQMSHKSTSTLRVKVDLIDELMNLVGELVLARGRLARVDSRASESEFNDALQGLSHVTDALQEGIMKTRMQPMTVAWGGVPRLVRDLAKECGKKVTVHLEGGETELDRSVIEAIKDPLVHLVRNAVDHGIEMPRDRVDKGKPETGNLWLKAFHEAGEINLEVIDDGRGVNTSSLRSRAVAAGFIDEIQADRLTEKEAHRLVFHPGISTATVVSRVSGRGVGMDVVRTNVESLGGVVDLNSTPDRGTRTVIKIPLTLAIIPAITVTCRAERFVIPQIYLQEFVRLDGEQGSARIEDIQGTAVCRLRHHLFPLVFLDEVLGKRQARGSAASRARDGQLVVLTVGGNWFGLVVDEIGAPEEIVVKPLPTMLRDIPVLSGAAVVGGGEVALILDVTGLAQQCRITTETTRSVGEETVRTAAGSNDSYIFAEITGQHHVALPVSAVERLEVIRPHRVEQTLHGPVFQQGASVVAIHDLAALLGIHAPSGTRLVENPAGPDAEAPSGGREHDEEVDDSIRLVVCRQGERLAALRVARIIDIVSDLTIRREADERFASIGRAVIDERVTDVVDPRRLLAGVGSNGEAR